LIHFYKRIINYPKINTLLLLHNKLLKVEDKEISSIAKQDAQS